MTQPTITFTARRYRFWERLSGAWFMLFSNWGR